MEGREVLNFTGIKTLQFDERWIKEFESTKQVISNSLRNLIITIEHVRSTSVHG
ncbi:GrpB-like predicted nucleotidyltransferase (UPF0157 family) [Metabacillus crassostreae]|uniref:GrpB family protein n=1 Tax=Metabacillus crassostreae TaxID=929098 RepID=UPI00195E0A52|nr:GrpB family protein [Metabacillus crassostreae]MBM7602417.1 GrpB-like predicted nucleotidyltransferase (UPF0157 family) [Metabacillus crassostreae]